MIYRAPSVGVVDDGCRDAYEKAFEDQLGLFRRAERVLPGGSVHDSQEIRPFPIYFDDAQGAFKWSAHGRKRFVDLWMGHGALLLGHSFPPVVESVAAQMRRGSHFGGPHPSVVRWAELVCEAVPSAERVRFVSSGTEATLLALRVARAFTGRQTVLKFDGNYHGWHDESLAYFSTVESSGLNPGAVEHVALADPTDAESAAEFIAEGNAAAVIIEPGGGGSGALPWSGEFLRTLRHATERHGTLLIFDEVVSGFRYSTGGVQKLCGVMPDLTVLGKILCGGLPGGAVAGRAAVMSVFGAGTKVGERDARVPHTGTFNANPLSAAAGTTTLEHIADGAAQAAARDAAQRMVDAVNHVAASSGVDVCLYANQTSIIHIMVGARAAGVPVGPSTEVVKLYQKHPERYAALRRALLIEGVDSHPLHGWLSAAHDAQVIEIVTGAFERAFRRLKDEAGFAV